MTEWTLAIRAEGVTEADIERGIAAAQTVFNVAGATPFKAAAACFKREGEIDDLSDEEIALCRVWEDADTAAAHACFAGRAGAPSSYVLELHQVEDRCEPSRH